MNLHFRLLKELSKRIYFSVYKNIQGNSWQFAIIYEASISVAPSKVFIRQLLNILFENVNSEYTVISLSCEYQGLS